MIQEIRHGDLYNDLFHHHQDKHGVTLSILHYECRLKSHPRHETEQRVHADITSSVLVQVRIDHCFDLGKRFPVVHD